MGWLVRKIRSNTVITGATNPVMAATREGSIPAPRPASTLTAMVMNCVHRVALAHQGFVIGSSFDMGHACCRSGVTVYKVKSESSSYHGVHSPVTSLGFHCGSYRP